MKRETLASVKVSVAYCFTSCVMENERNSMSEHMEVYSYHISSFGVSHCDFANDGYVTVRDGYEKLPEWQWTPSERWTESRLEEWRNS